MTKQSQGLLMAFLGVVLVRLSLSDAYLRYVTPWMKWPILVTGGVLVVLGMAAIFTHRPDEAAHGQSDDQDHSQEETSHGSHRVPLVTWLLVLPGLLVFLISPPQLGSYLAERRSGDVVAAPEPEGVAELGGDQDGVVPVPVVEFVWRAQDGGETLEGRTVALTGFVSYDPSGNWYVTRMTMGCCAADAVAYRVLVEDADKPPRDQWVRVTGGYVTGSGTGSQVPPTIRAAEVEKVDQPKQTYE